MFRNQCFYVENWICVTIKRPAGLHNNLQPRKRQPRKENVSDDIASVRTQCGLVQRATSIWQTFTDKANNGVAYMRCRQCDEPATFLKQPEAVTAA